jgi:2'-5' RNA ligase
MNEEKRRLFVALFPLKIHAKVLVSHIDTWKVRTGKEVHWVSPEKLHLTLCFLGDVLTKDLDPLEQSLFAKITKVGAFTVGLKGLGCFPKIRSPKVLWIGLGEDKERLMALQKIVAGTCEPFMESPKNKPFSPHLTVAQIRRLERGHERDIERLVKEERETDFGYLEAWGVQLMSSELGPEGSKYSEIAAIPLGNYGP